MLRDGVSVSSTVTSQCSLATVLTPPWTHLEPQVSVKQEKRKLSMDSHKVKRQSKSWEVESSDIHGDQAFSKLQGAAVCIPRATDKIIVINSFIK